MLNCISFTGDKLIYFNELVTELLNSIDNLAAQQPDVKVSNLEKTIINLKAALKHSLEEKTDLQMRLEAMTNTQRLHYSTIGDCMEVTKRLSNDNNKLTEANELMTQRLRDIEDSNQFLRNSIKKYHAIEQSLKNYFTTDNATKGYNF